MSKVLREETINPHLKNVKFSWPNKIMDRSKEIEKELNKGTKFSFDKVRRQDSANPLAIGQKRLTFIQEVLAVCADKRLLDFDIYPSDVKQRAKNIIDNCDGNCTGSYSLSSGIPGVRKQIAKFLERRDGVPSKEDDIILTAGASEGVQILLQLFSQIESPKPPSVLIPVPEYSLFKAVTAQYGIQEIKYFLNEEKHWAVDTEELQKVVDDSRFKFDCKALVITNPGNPGGYCMTRKDIEDIIKFAFKENLLIIADEVYQQNIYYSDRPFISFKKVMYEMGRPYRDMELASLMSSSKGFMGECGERSGYIELFNVDDEIKDILSKLVTVRVCPSILGQVVMYCICYPPELGEPSFELYEKEKNDILQEMKFKVEYGNKMFNSTQGLTCSKVDSSMFFYPRIHFPTKALKEAEKRRLQPDELYCIELLEKTGICVLPGCQFGQKPGTYHFRYVFLSPEKNNLSVDKIIEFHRNFMKKYADKSKPVDKETRCLNRKGKFLTSGIHMEWRNL